MILPALPANSRWEDHMARFFLIRIPAIPATSKELNTTPGGAIRAAALATTMLATAAPCWSADVTVDRLINADKEPQNWLMNHRTYDGQRFSPLTRIDRGNVKNLKLAYAVPLGGTTGNESVEATPLVENGFLYITDGWGVLYKIRRHLRGCRPHHLAHGSEAGEEGQ
jgi:glucose dehydrogenase